MRSIQQGIGSALLFLALSVTFKLLSSTCAASVNFQNYTTVHLKGVKEVEVPKQVTNNRTSETYETATFDSFGPHRNQVFGTWDRYPHDCDEKRGGGWWYTDAHCAVWSNLNGLYFDNKTSRAIYWSRLGTIPEESIPKSAEMKIRPVDFVSSF